MSAALLEDDDEPMTRRRAVTIGAIIATCLLSAVWLDGREARARCAEGVDTVASCQGIVR